jgi:hypothetical protein
VSTGSLTISSNDPTRPTTLVQLAGYWQTVSENGQEPTSDEVVNQVFGYTTSIANPGQTLNQNGLVMAVGDEVLSPYWQRAVTTSPVVVRQISAFHTYPNPATFGWFARSSGTSSPQNVLTSVGIEAQAVNPHLGDFSGRPARTSFTPNATAFGFVVDNVEWSDPALNDQTADRSNGCPGPCGHHVRFWPVKDRAGLVVANTYLMLMDYSGINYDYNDNVYLISNIKPALP